MEIFTLMCSVTSLVLAVASLIHTIHVYHETVIHDRKESTLNSYNILQEQAFDKLNLYTPAQIRDVAQNPKSKDYKIISGYIARIEHFCVGVNLKIYDRETVYELAHGYMDESVLLERIKPIIEKKNRNRENFYENIELVIKWMNQKTDKIK
ncbi:MAG: hypothetical protein IJ039_02910 [Clostridia bacterium]|nr:hypothetical protein [Clostridia bacterium]